MAVIRSQLDRETQKRGSEDNAQSNHGMAVSHPILRASEYVEHCFLTLMGGPSWHPLLGDLHRDLLFAAAHRNQNNQISAVPHKYFDSSVVIGHFAAYYSAIDRVFPSPV